MGLFQKYVVHSLCFADSVTQDGLHYLSIHQSSGICAAESVNGFDIKPQQHSKMYFVCII